MKCTCTTFGQDNTDDTSCLIRTPHLAIAVPFLSHENPLSRGVNRGALVPNHGAYCVVYLEMNSH